jgi:apolipoprotein N-acyltransferase
MLRGRGLAGAALLGFAWGLGYEGGVTWWVQETLRRHTALPPFGVLAAHAAMAAILASGTALFALVLVLGARRGRAWWWLAPATWVAVEWARGQTAFWFPWTHLGYTQAGHPVLVQVAALTGVYGVSALVVFGNVTLANAVAAPTWRGAARWLGTGGAVVLVVAALGALRLHMTPLPADTLRVALVDGYVDETEKWQPEVADLTLGRYAQLTLAAAAAEPDLVVWPETALPFFVEDPGTRRDHVLALARQAGVPLLVGAPAFEAGAAPGVAQHNRVHLVGPDGAGHGHYDKHVLAPFGEYVPTPWLAARVRPLAVSGAPIEPGRGENVLDAAGIRLGVLVCYENVFPWLARRAVTAGATLLVNPSNDAWYAGTAAPAQQRAHTALRAVELGVPSVRVANRGVLAVADARGRLVWERAPREPAWHVVAVPFGGPRTLYARWGDVFAWACVASVLWAVGGRHGTRRPTRSAIYERLVDPEAKRGLH